MTHLLHRIPMGRKFLLVLLLPLLGLGGFAASGILERQKLASNMHQLTQLMTLSGHAGNLVHELQRERGMSAGYLGSDGQRFGERLTTQRLATDERVATLEDALASLDLAAMDGELAERADDAEQRLAATAAMRRRIDALSADVDAAVAHYTELNGALMGLVGRLSHVADHPGLARRLAAYHALLNAKDLAGIERAMLANAFAADAMSPRQYERLLSLFGREATFLQEVETLANDETRTHLEQALSGEEIDRLAPLRRRAVELGTDGGYDVDPQRWFDWQTVKLGRLKEVEDALAAGILAKAAELRGDAREERVTYLLVTLMVLVIACGLAIWIVRSIVRPLRRALTAIETSGGDLTRRLAVPGSDELSRLYRAYNDASADTERLVASIKQGALSVEGASGEIAQGNQDLAQRTEEQSASLVETASSLEQLTATVRQNADHARHAESLTDEVTNQTVEARRISQQAHETMQQIRTANQEVTAVVAAIDSIAFQTNLLALNASVEAARAGQHGRGFAVVAAEVRKLASRCADEANQIRHLVETSVARIREGESRVGATHETLEAMARQVTNVSAVVREIAAATTEQSAGIEQISQAVGQLEEVTQHNAALVEQVAAASRSLDDQAGDMAGLVGRFRVGETASADTLRLPEPA